MTSVTDAPELEAIAQFWGHAYTFSHHPDDRAAGPYHASRKDGHRTIRAATPALLLDAIKDDAGPCPIAPAHGTTPALGLAVAPPPAPGPRPCPPGSRYASAALSRYASAELHPRPAAPAQARQFTRDCLARWDMRGLIADAEAIASELTTNAVAAVPPGSAGLAIIYAIHASPPTGLHIHVWDIGPGHPRPAHPGPDAETGRGLTIIDALASNWGWWPTPASGGKVVHATLTARNAQDTPHEPGQPAATPPPDPDEELTLTPAEVARLFRVAPQNRQAMGQRREAQQLPHPRRQPPLPRQRNRAPPEPHPAQPLTTTPTSRNHPGNQPCSPPPNPPSARPYGPTSS